MGFGDIGKYQINFMQKM